MNHKEILIEAVTTLNKYKRAGIEITDFWGDLDGDIHATFKFNKAKGQANEQILHFNRNWFDWNYKIDKSVVDIEKAKIPEHLPEEQKVILRLAFSIWEIMIANEYI